MASFGFNFRQTEGFVTDSAPDTWVGNDPTIATAYPTTRNGITFGWLGAVNVSVRDRSTGVGVRFAGTHFANSSTVPVTFQIDLPNTGTWRIRAAFGEQAYARTIFAVLKDSATTFATIDGVTTASNRYLDATGVERTSPTDWTTNNAHVDRVFTSTVLSITLADGASKDGFIAHLDIEELGGGPEGPIPYTPRRQLDPVFISL